MPPSLVIQTSFLGDTILTTPLLTRLAQDGAVDVMVTPASAGLLANHPAVRDVIIYDKRNTDNGVGGFLRLVRRTREARYAAAYMAQGSVRSGALAFAAGIRRRVGFRSSDGHYFYTQRVPYIEGAHHAERLLALADPAKAGALKGSGPRPSLFPGVAERTRVDEFLREHGATGQPLIGLAPGSVWATKQWPAYGALAKALSSMGRVVVIGSPADTPLATAIRAAAMTEGPDSPTPGGFEADGTSSGSRANEVIDATGRLSLLGSAELIGRLRILITNDSAPLHLASAMNTPTVAIFGPTIPEFGFGPLATSRAVIGRDTLDCRPCDRHGPRVCPLGHWRCMREITPESVARVVRDLIPAP